MVRRASLGVEPYQGKVLEDQNGPIDATRKSEAPWTAPLPTLTPDHWVRFWVAKSMRFQDSMSHHHLVDSTAFVVRASVLKKWLLNAEQGLMTAAECDVVIEAMQRSPNDPVDPLETPAVVRERNYALDLARARVIAKRAELS